MENRVNNACSLTSAEYLEETFIPISQKRLKVVAEMTSILHRQLPEIHENTLPYHISNDSSSHSADDHLSSASVRKHPLGVRPSGNALTADQDLSLSMGIFGRIPDALLLLLLEWLDEDALLKLSRTCRGLFAYATHDQLWRDLALNSPTDDFTWRGSWRSSLLRLSKPSPRVDCRFLFSDALYRPFQCTNVSLPAFSENIPPNNRIKRLSELSLGDFTTTWANKPFVLTEPVKNWAAYREWDGRQLLAQYGDVRFRAEAVDWKLADYWKYMQNNQDESPLYLFDRSFVQKMDLVVGKGGAYEVPDCFAEDLFTLLEEQRPDHAWLIIGPERSGSTFHKDPNATSAWNAVIRGYKYWIMFPNSVIPPGVYMSEDQSEVTSPLSIGEWLLTFHDEARQTPGCVEGICGPGEVLHVPSGWWHLVVNLESAIAITQNFVPKSHLRSAVNFLKHKPDQVSGFQSTVENPYALFMERLRTHHADLFAELEETGEKKRKWEQVVATQDEDGTDRGGFSFGFGDDIEEEE